MVMTRKCAADHVALESVNAVMTILWTGDYEGALKATLKTKPRDAQLVGVG